jgi:hypothetical protein
MTEETITMKAIVVTDQAAGTAGMKLVERPEPDVILRLPLCAQFQTDAVNAFNPHTIAMKNGWLLGCRGLRFGKRRELGVCGVG